MTERIEFVLPYPPTVNTYWRRHGNTYFISEAGKRYRRDVALIVRQQRLKLNLSGRLAIKVIAEPPDKRRRDLDNILKAPLDALTHELAQCAGVIGVDSGVSHIAVALDLPHVQIYNFDTAWRTGPEATSARQVSVYATPEPSVDAVWQAWLGCVETVPPAQIQPSEPLAWPDDA